MKNSLKDSRKIIRNVYKEVDGYEIPIHDKKSIRLSKGSHLYGEITFGSTQKLLKALEIDEKDVMFDLGSGVGKLILQVALTTDAKKCVGIELSSERCQTAQSVLKDVVAHGYISNKRCQFLCRNILESDLSKATVVYTCSTAFSVVFMKLLLNHVAQHPQIRAFVSLQEIPPHRNFELITEISLDMTWARRTPVYIYKLVNITRCEGFKSSY